MSRTSALGRAKAPIRVAEYVRMSSEHQQYSTQNQSAAIEAYAAAHAMVVVKRYCDESRSGLRLNGRRALQQLLRDVRSGQCDFEVVLVLDVSRWGRFQNPDEAAYHEFVCHLGGVRVIYVGEPFSNDGTPLTAVLKGLKRAMAGEYSRELSAKVYAGQKRLIGLGYRQGGMAGYGLRRMRLDASGAQLGLLSRGQLKGVTTDRIILVLGPEAEVKVVRGIFRDYVAGVFPVLIAQRLNDRGIANVVGKRWTAPHVRSVLGNSKYIGDNVYGRTRGTLHQARVRVPESEWVKASGAFSPIVSKRLFNAAQQLSKIRSTQLTDDQLLAPLRAILARDGHISTRLIQAEPGARSIPSLVRRFGGLRQIYDRIGFKPGKNLIYADARFYLRDVREHITTDAVDLFEGLGVHVTRDGSRLSIENAWSLSFTVLRTSMYRNVERWYIRQHPENTDIVVFVRMSQDGVQTRDYVIWPRVIVGGFPKDVSSRACASVAAYTVSSLGDVPGSLGYGPLVDGEQQGNDVLRLVVLSGRVRLLLRDAEFVGWLARHHPRELALLQSVSESVGIRSSW